MLECFDDIKNVNFDCLTFFPDYEKDALAIQGQQYKNPGETIGGSKMGYEWHIVLFREGEDKFTDLDTFDAILSSPLDYVSNLITQGWYGIIAKKTTTSQEFLKKSLDIIQRAV